MITHITDYQSPQEFAKTYMKENGEVGVSRAYINQLIAKEIKKPGTTGIDVLEVGSGKARFVRYTVKAK